MLTEARQYAAHGLADKVGIEHLLLALLTCEKATDFGTLGLSELDTKRVRETLLTGLGVKLLRGLFAIYGKRLSAHDWKLEYDPDVLDWLINQPV